MRPVISSRLQLAPPALLLLLIFIVVANKGVRANWWSLGIEPRIVSSHGAGASVSGAGVGGGAISSPQTASSGSLSSGLSSSSSSGSGHVEVVGGGGGGGIVGFGDALPVPQPIGAGVLGPSNVGSSCKNPSLTPKQQAICLRSPPVLQAISAGAKLAIEECQHQFKSARWNCTIHPDSDNIFGGVTQVNSREAAFIYAISAAGVAYSVTRACSRGELTDCSCDNRVRTRAHSSNWQWGGCSEDIHFGEKFSREWSEAGEEPIKEGLVHGSDGLAGLLMRRHDSEAGRRAVRSRMQRVCKCHGMSGSCSVRVCWRKLPTFRAAGTALAQAHEGAALVRLTQRGSRRPARLRPARPELKRPNKTDLVYLEDSPDYCERNLTLGILGTRGRVCNRTSLGLDGCRLLCCGRGYQTRVRDVVEKCNCRFVWCCDVKCEMCRHTREEHVCN